MSVWSRGSLRAPQIIEKIFRTHGIKTPRHNLCTSQVFCQNQKSFLSHDYETTAAWEKRLESPLLKKLELEEFFHQIDTKYQTDKVLSAIDVDLFVNKATEADDLDDVEELTYRLRKSPATSNTLPSTGYAVIRAFLALNRTDDLMRMLNDRMNYGVFLDHYTSNLLMNTFLGKENYRDAAKVATLLMLQEDFGPNSTKYFSLLSCLKYLENPNPAPWDPFEVVQEEVVAVVPRSKKKQEEERIRMKVQRNLFYDDHFHITNPEYLLGKTLVYLGFNLSEEDKCLKYSMELLGWAMFDKWNKVESTLAILKKENTAIASSVIERVKALAAARIAEIEASPGKIPPRPKLKPIPGGNLEPEEVEALFTKLKWNDFYTPLPKIEKAILEIKRVDINLISKTEEYLTKSVSASEKNEIELQLQNYKDWEELREQELQKQMQRIKDVETLLEIQAKKKELSEREEVIFFFDNEEQWMMRQPAPPPPPPEEKIDILHPKAQKKKAVEDESYVPPEVHTFSKDFTTKPGTPTAGPRVYTKKKKT